MVLMILIGLGLLIWHLAIYPDPPLNDPAPLRPVRVEGIAPFVAVASQHDDGAAVGFTASLHQGSVANSLDTCTTSPCNDAGSDGVFRVSRCRVVPDTNTPTSGFFRDGQI